MPYKQQFKNVFKDKGKRVNVHYYGVEYEGIIIEYEGMNPNNAHVTIEQDDGTLSILPVSENMVVNIMPDSDEVAKDFQHGKDAASKKSSKSKKKVDEDDEDDIEDEDFEEDEDDDEEDEDAYEDWTLKELKAECKNRGIKVRKGVRKPTLIKLLIEDDASE